MRRVRIGLLGLGAMGRNHARVLSSLEKVDFVGAADLRGDPEGLTGPRPVVTSLDDLLRLDVDAVVAAIPTALHEDVGFALAEAGVHALIEKPLAASVDGALRLATAFEEAGLVGAVGHIERFNPALQQLRTRLLDGELGVPYEITTTRVGPYPSRIRDVGVVFDLATHDIDLTAWVTRSPFASVYAESGHRARSEHEDQLAVTGRLANGVITNHLVSWLSPRKIRQTVVTGERGSYVADTLTGDLTFHANGETPMDWAALSTFRGVSQGDVIRYAYPKKEPLAAELEAFRDAVLGERDAVVTMRQGLTAVRVAAAILTSSREHRRVDVEQLEG